MSKIPIQTPNIHLVTVYTVNDLAKARLIKIALEDHDIPCDLGGEHQGGLTGTLAVEIIVRESDCELAKEIMKDHNLL